jgi:NifU-like protein involved in Fe-S cluster formation
MEKLLTARQPVCYFTDKAAVIQLMSNPVNNGLLQLQRSKTETIKMCNNQGQLMLQTQLGTGLQSIDVSRFAKAVQTASASVKVVIQ